MTRSIRASLFVVLAPSVLLHAGPPLAESARNPKSPMSLSEEGWGGTLLGGGVKTNGEFTEGSLFLVGPLIDDIGQGSTMEGSLLFVEPYLTWAEGGELGASLGLGFRHLFSNQTPAEARSASTAGLLTEGLFVGGNVFMDYLNSAEDNDFWQIGVVAEAGTRYFEVRGNYYIPVTDDQTIRRVVSTSSDSVTRTTSRTSTGAQRVSGTQIVQDVTRRTFTTTTTRTTRSTIEYFEEALEGWDVEAAFLVPGVDRYFDMKIIGGFYSYEGDRSRVSDFEGWRAGVEIRPVPAIVLHATWFESDRLYRDNWLAGVRFEVPLGEGWRDAFKSRRRHLAERLYEPVHRKNSAITLSGAVPEVVGSSTSTSSQTQQTGSTSTQVVGTTEAPQTTTTPTTPTTPVEDGNNDCMNGNDEEE